MANGPADELLQKEIYTRAVLANWSNYSDETAQLSQLSILGTWPTSQAPASSCSPLPSGISIRRYGRGVGGGKTAFTIPLAKDLLELLASIVHALPGLSPLGERRDHWMNRWPQENSIH